MPHTLDSAIKGQIKNLFHEFMTEYLLPKIDQPQIQLIETSRTEASKNWEAIKALRTKGESITDDVLKNCYLTPTPKDTEKKASGSQLPQRSMETYKVGLKKVLSAPKLRIGTVLLLQSMN
jgi:hypothetical protein